jgi:hypothetical protein
MKTPSFSSTALARYKGVQLTLDKDPASDCFSDGRHSRFKVLVLGKISGFWTVGSRRMQAWSDLPTGGRILALS